MEKLNYWLYKIALKVISKTIINSNTPLTKEYLISKGWVTEADIVPGKIFYVEPNIKDRDKISVEFENHYYRIWHSEKRTFIALKTSKEWFVMYYSLINN